MGKASVRDRGLTVNQRRYVDEYLKCGNPTEAFRKANPRTITWMEKSIIESGNRTFHTPAVFAEIARFKELENVAIIARSSVTKADVIEKLQQLSNKAESEGVYGVAVRCQELLGKTLGLFIERTESVQGTIVLNSNLPDRDGSLTRELKKIERTVEND